MNKRRVLIAGASGYLGRYLVRAFAGAGYQVNALVRRAENIAGLCTYIDNIVTAEMTDQSTLDGVCTGVDIVISAVGITRQRDGLSYWDVDYRGNLNLLEEAQRARVAQFAYVHIFGDEGLSSVEAVRAKGVFVAQLVASGLDYRVIKPTGFFSDMAANRHHSKRRRYQTDSP